MRDLPFPPPASVATPCRESDPDLWFREGPEAVLRAKALCMQDCPIYQQCAQYALAEGIPWGIWGGLDVKDRERIWKRTGGRPTRFDESMDLQIRPLLQARRDYENFDTQHPGDVYEGGEAA